MVTMLRYRKRSGKVHQQHIFYETNGYRVRWDRNGGEGEMFDPESSHNHLVTYSRVVNVEHADQRRQRGTYSSKRNGLWKKNAIRPCVSSEQ